MTVTVTRWAKLDRSAHRHASRTNPPPVGVGEAHWQCQLTLKVLTSRLLRHLQSPVPRTLSSPPPTLFNTLTDQPCHFKLLGRTSGSLNASAPIYLLFFVFLLAAIGNYSSASERISLPGYSISLTMVTYQVRLIRATITILPLTDLIDMRKLRLLACRWIQNPGSAWGGPHCMRHSHCTPFSVPVNYCSAQVSTREPSTLQHPPCSPADDLIVTPSCGPRCGGKPESQPVVELTIP